MNMVDVLITEESSILSSSMEDFTLCFCVNVNSVCLSDRWKCTVCSLEASDGQASS